MYYVYILQSVKDTCLICKNKVKKDATVCTYCRHYIDKHHPVIKFFYNNIKRLTFAAAFVALILNGILSILTFLRNSGSH